MITNLVANHENKVFHQECLTDVDPGVKMPCLALYGVNFSAPREESKISAALRQRRHEVAQRQKEVEELKKQLEETKRTQWSRQKKKLDEERRRHAKLDGEHRLRTAELSKVSARYDTMQETIHSQRDREIMASYLERFDKDPREALKFLARWVEMAKDPSFVLANLSRLKEHYREAAERRRQDTAEKDRELSRLKSEAQRRRDGVAEVERKLKRANSRSDHSGSASKSRRPQPMP